MTTDDESWERTEAFLRAGGWPVSLNFQCQLGAKSVDIDFAARPGSAVDSLLELKEAELVERALGATVVVDFLIEWLGVRRPWILIAEPRHTLLPPDWQQGKPGDFDMIVGEANDDGTLGFGFLASVEVKVRRLDRDGSAGRSPASGDRQARGAARLGFDRALLLHFLVHEPAPTGARWEAALATDARSAALAQASRMRSAYRADAPYGYAMLGWGTVQGTDPALVGGFCPLPVWPAPWRPLAGDAQAQDGRRLIEDGLRRVLGVRRPWAAFLKRCRECHGVFETGLASMPRCASCG